MDAKIHSENSGDGDFLGYSYMAIPYKIEADSPEEIEEKAAEFDKEMQTVLERFPEITHITTVGESIACMAHTLRVAENVA